jgi:hypothetical protein
MTEERPCEDIVRHHLWARKGILIRTGIRWDLNLGIPTFQICEK